MSSTTPQQGAGAALKRAETAEKDLYESWRKLQTDYERYASGSNLDHEVLLAMGKNVKLAFDMYKNASQTLLGYDKGVDQSKRLEGESITQKACCFVFAYIIRFLRIAMEKLIIDLSQELSICKTNEERYDLFADKFRFNLRHVFDTAIKEQRLPKWLVPTIEEEL
jgi:hypothetical protein